VEKPRILMKIQWKIKYDHATAGFRKQNLPAGKTFAILNVVNFFSLDLPAMRFQACFSERETSS
jgi:hypothetical protein